MTVVVEEEEQRASVVGTDTPVRLLIGNLVCFGIQHGYWGISRAIADEGISESHSSSSKSRSRNRLGFVVLGDADRGREHG